MTGPVKPRVTGAPGGPADETSTAAAGRAAEVFAGAADEVADDVLLRHHLEGDRNAFGLLVSRHRDRLWAVALRTLGDPDDAADAVQDALVKAYLRAETFRGDAAVTTWLHRIVVNACLDLLRRRSARPVDPVDPLDGDVLGERSGEEHAMGLRAPADPEGAVLQREERDRVLAALDTLPIEQRAALVLVDMQGWSVAEAATMLACAPGTVKSRCARGRARLAPLLRDVRPVAEGHTGADGNRSSSRGVPSREQQPRGQDRPSRHPGGRPAADVAPEASGTQDPKRTS